MRGRGINDVVLGEGKDIYFISHVVKQSLHY